MMDSQENALEKGQNEVIKEEEVNAWRHRQMSQLLK